MFQIISILIIIEYIRNKGNVSIRSIKKVFVYLSIAQLILFFIKINTSKGPGIHEPMSPVIGLFALLGGIISVSLFILLCIIIYNIFKQKTFNFNDPKSTKIFLIVIGLVLVIGGGIGLIVISEHQWDLMREGSNPKTLNTVASIGIVLGIMIFIGGLLHSKIIIEKRMDNKTVSTALEELEELKKKGQISIEDFEVKKREILNRL